MTDPDDAKAAEEYVEARCGASSMDSLQQRIKCRHDFLSGIAHERGKMLDLAREAYAAGQNSIGWRDDQTSRIDGDFDQWIHKRSQPPPKDFF